MTPQVSYQTLSKGLHDIAASRWLDHVPDGVVDAFASALAADHMTEAEWAEVVKRAILSLDPMPPSKERLHVMLLDVRKAKTPHVM
jgi:hypothetical protein